MKELSKKTFITIFSLLSLFLIISLVIINVQNYNREYESVKRNLNIVDFRKNDFQNNDIIKPPDLDNMMVMDYEVYTVTISNNEVSKIISHGNQSKDFDIVNIAQNILNSNNENNFKVGNLFFSKYSYNYIYNNYIVVLNNKSTNERLISELIKTIIVFVVAEVFIYIVSKQITMWITKPANDAFKKQKDFIADASHELKTPLAVIMASSDELKSDKKNVQYVDNIKYEAERMSTLITSMLDLSKLESGFSKKTYNDENISKIVQKICLTFEGIAFEEEVKILTNIEENIHLKCSKEEIEKLISINLDNAIKHSYKKSIVKVNMHKEKNNIIIEIINSGDPIKPGDEEKIFERFYRVDKARNRKENRYGLGLAIAKSIAQNYNGSITANSNKGKTTFKICLYGQK